MRKMVGMIAAMAMLTSSTLAFADTQTQQQQGALAPGNAAGIEKAQGWMGSNTLLLLLGLGIVAGGIALAAGGGGGGSTTTTTGH